MAKKKKQQGSGQQFLSPEKYLRERARTLEIGTCYVTKDIDEAKMGHIIVYASTYGIKPTMPKSPVTTT